MPRMHASVLEWPKCAAVAVQIIHTVFSEALSRTPFHDHLCRVVDGLADGSTSCGSIASVPALTCAAAGGDMVKAAPLVAAWELVRLAAKQLDDIQDRDESTSADAINTAIALVFAAQLAIARLSQRKWSARFQQVSIALSRAVVRSAAGQHADLMASRRNVERADPDAWLEIALAKSGELVAWAAWAGALVGGANERMVLRYREYGRRLGVLLQLADDFSDTWYLKERSDIATSRLSLATCYAWSVTNEQVRVRLQTLFEQANKGDKMAESQARQLMIDLGAQAFLLVTARLQQRHAMAALRRARCINEVLPSLVALLNQMFPALSFDKEVADAKTIREHGCAHQQSACLSSHDDHRWPEPHYMVGCPSLAASLSPRSVNLLLPT